MLTEKTEFKVEVVQIGPIQKHPNADTLSLVDVDGYPVVIKTGSFHDPRCGRVALKYAGAGYLLRKDEAS